MLLYVAMFVVSLAFYVGEEVRERLCVGHDIGYNGSPYDDAANGDSFVLVVLLFCGKAAGDTRRYDIIP